MDDTRAVTTLVIIVFGMLFILATILAISSLFPEQPPPNYTIQAKAEVFLGEEQ